MIVFGVLYNDSKQTSLDAIFDSREKAEDYILKNSNFTETSMTNRYKDFYSGAMYQIEKMEVE